MRKLLTYEEAMALTEPHHALWINAHAAAEKVWREVETTVPEFAIAQTASAKAHDFHNLVARYLEQHPADGVVSTWCLGFFAQFVTKKDHSALVRFKLLDSVREAKNHISDQQDSLRVQAYTEEMMEQLAFDGIVEPPTFLTCGWIPSPDGSVAEVVVTCRYGRNELYHYGLVEGGSAQVIPFPLGSEPPAPRITSRQAPSISDNTER